jgi:hypothetical protein
MPKTLNKDGTPRKIGSGKTKGAGCYSPISWSDLKNLISNDVQIPVSRVWLRSLDGVSEDRAPKKIPDQPSASPPSKVIPPKNDQPQKKSIPSVSKEDPPALETGEEYEPPPLFAGGPSKFRQY